MEDNNYSGISGYISENEKVKADVNMLKSCMPGAFMNSSDAYTYYPYFGNCPEFMSERCSKKWDEHCELYLNNFLNVDEAKDFLDKTALRKYTLFDKNNNMPSCHPVFELANPLKPGSPIISDIPGAQSFYENSPGNGVRYQHPQLSPTFRVSCQDDMNNLQPKYKEGDFSENDGLFQNCMKYKTCNKSLGINDKVNVVYETRISRPRNNINRNMFDMKNYAVYEKPFDRE
jgi:hypothetical protein